MSDPQPDRAHPLALIAAVAANGVIGAGGGLPWRLPADLKHFRRTTLGHHVIMGRRTWESLPKPLAGRVNVVVTRQPRRLRSTIRPPAEPPSPSPAVNDGGADREVSVVAVDSLDAAIAVARAAGDPEPFVIGGEMLYRAALDQACRIYLTRIHAAFRGDARFPDVDPAVWVQTRCEEHPAGPDNPLPHAFCRLERRR